MADIIYTLCALTAFLCTWLLLQAWRRSGYELLLWGGLCFSGFTLNNILLIIDEIMLPNVADLSIWRLVVALASSLILLYGLIWEKE